MTAKLKGHALLPNGGWERNPQFNPKVGGGKKFIWQLRCECGAMCGHDASDVEQRKWHRAHKAEVRAGAGKGEGK